jgi:hypothetical protein
MNLAVVAGAGAASVAVALATVLAGLRRPLAATFAELCGERHRGDFWTMVSQVALVAGTAMVVLGGGAMTGSFEARTPPWIAVLGLLRWGLVGLLLSLATVVALVVRFTAQLERHAPPSYGAGSLLPRPPAG